MVKKKNNYGCSYLFHVRIWTYKLWNHGSLPLVKKYWWVHQFHLLSALPLLGSTSTAPQTDWIQFTFTTCIILYTDLRHDLFVYFKLGLRPVNCDIMSPELDTIVHEFSPSHRSRAMAVVLHKRKATVLGFVWCGRIDYDINHSLCHLCHLLNDIIFGYLRAGVWEYHR